MKQVVVQNTQILGGKPIIAGTRMSIESILELLSSGMETKEILREYPFLTREHISTALDYAAKMVAKEESYIFSKVKHA